MCKGVDRWPANHGTDPRGAYCKVTQLLKNHMQLQQLSFSEGLNNEWPLIMEFKSAMNIMKAHGQY